MRTRGGIVLVGVAVLGVAVSGCASAPTAAPTSTATSSSGNAPSSTPSAPSSEETEAQQRADTWLETTPTPPGAVRSDESPSPLFDISYQGWVCAPTLTTTGYWTLDGMSLGDALVWMRSNPTPGLTTVNAGMLPVDDSADVVTMGVTPAPESQEGVVLTFVKTPTGAAVRAEVGAMTASATCPPPPDGGEWGHPGEG